MGGQQSSLALECRTLSSPSRVLAALRSFGSPSPQSGQHGSAGSTQTHPDDAAERSRQAPRIDTSEQEVRQTDNSGEVRRLSFSSAGASCKDTSPLHGDLTAQGNQATVESVPVTAHGSGQVDQLGCSPLGVKLDFGIADAFAQPITSCASTECGSDRTVADVLPAPPCEETGSENGSRQVDAMDTSCKETNESGLAPESHEEAPNDMAQVDVGESEGEPCTGIQQEVVNGTVGVEQRYDDEFISELPCGRGQVSADCAVEAGVGLSDAVDGEQDLVTEPTSGGLAGVDEEHEELAAGTSHVTQTRMDNANHASSAAGDDATAPQCSQSVAEGRASAGCDADDGGQCEPAAPSSSATVEGMGSQESDKAHECCSGGQDSEATMDNPDVAFGVDDTRDPSFRPSDSSLTDPAADASEAAEEAPTAAGPAAAPLGPASAGRRQEGTGPGAGRAAKGKAARAAEKINTGLRGAAARVRRGVVVRLFGLDARPELNGATGLCVYAAGEGRWAVHLDCDAPGVFRNVRKENLQVVACGGALRGSPGGAATPCRGKRQREAATPLSRDAVIDGIAELECEALKRCGEEERPGLRRRLLLKWHPDKAPTGPSRELATKVTQAMQNLPHW